ncbi:MAG: 2'-5' RNA ligase [Clostridia bacterium]|nr:2'-5' RNA ligase [Clostridia bacterium]
MQDKALYVLAQFGEETQNILAGYYDVLYLNGFIGSQTKNIPYHFTLGSRSIDCEEQTINDLEKICSDTPCFEINLAHIGLFDLSVLFICPNMNFELLKLQQCFFPDSGNGYHLWVAHATLLIDEPEAIHEALLIVAQNFKPFKARIESVALYEFFSARFIYECKLRR